MPFSTIDSTTALIVIDLQRGIVALPLAHPVEDVVARCTELITAFRKRGQPVVLVNVDGVPPGRTDAGRTPRSFPPDWTELIPQLDPQPDDLRVTKRSPGAFADTGLVERLRELGVTQVVVVGIATSAGVEATARHAWEHGFHVALPVDAMTDRSAEAHRRSVETVFPGLAETGDTRELLALLDSARA